MRDRVVQKDSGFSLIEVILSLVLAGIMATVASMGIVSFAKGYMMAKENTHTAQKAQLAMGRLTRELTELSSIAAGSDATTISFVSKSGSRHIGLDNGTVEIDELNADLSTGDVLIDNVESFTLSYYKDYQADPKVNWVPGTDDIDLLTAIRVELTLSGVGGNFSIIVFPRNI